MRWCCRLMSTLQVMYATGGVECNYSSVHLSFLWHWRLLRATWLARSRTQEGGGPFCPSFDFLSRVLGVASCSLSCAAAASGAVPI